MSELIGIPLAFAALLGVCYLWVRLLRVVFRWFDRERT